ncbi:sigma-70 family RNA polymerase sigma factor [Chitinophaga sp. Cy-1792]|uniref:RNA polymerase sigma factor n=1 Tax=Chitinophaga sp. Cy-1792 TaxID=2608339 RepID=UPI0014213438
MNKVYEADEVLLERVAHGDQAAFTQLFNAWYPYLDSHIFRVTGCKQLTEEIVQDVFLKIWHNRSALLDVKQFKPYLLVVSRNHAINALQKKAREFSALERYSIENGQPADAAEPDADLYELIDEAIDQLSPRQKEIYLLHRHQRFTYQQIAAQLNISRETVKTHLETATRHISRHVQLKLTLAITIISLLK